MEKKTHVFKYSKAIEDAVSENKSLNKSLKAWYFIQEQDYSNRAYKIKLETNCIFDSDRSFWKEVKIHSTGVEIKKNHIELCIPILYENTVLKISCRKMFKKHSPTVSGKNNNIFEECANKYIKCIYKRKLDFLKYLAINKSWVFESLAVDTFITNAGLAMKTENCKMEEGAEIVKTE